MKVLPIQHNYYVSRKNNQTNFIQNKQALPTDSTQKEQSSAVNFQGLLYYLTKDKHFDVVNKKTALQMIEQGLSSLNTYSKTEIAKTEASILNKTKRNSSKYYKSVIQKILELAKENITIYNLLDFDNIQFTPYEFDKIADKILHTQKLGYPIDYMPILFNEKIFDENSIKKLVDIRSESLKRKDLLFYNDEQVEDNMIDELLLSEPSQTLNTLKILGKKSFLATFEDKYDNVENNILNIGDLDENFSLFEELIKLTNPKECNIYKENQEKISSLKKLYQKNKNDKNTQDKINTLTRFNRNLIENSIKDTKEKTLIGHAAFLLKEKPAKLKQLLRELNTNTKYSKRKVDKILNNCILTNSKDEVEKRIDFRKTNFIPELIRSDADFCRAFLAFLDTLAQYPSLPIETTLKKLPMNIETKKQFSALGVDYNNWVKFNPKSNIKKEIAVNTSSLKQHAIKNLENDFNDPLFTKIPPEEFKKLEDNLAKNGYFFREQNCAEYIDDGYFNSIKTKLKLFKNNKPIEFDDLPELMKILKRELTHSDFWEHVNSNSEIENARITILDHLLKLRNSEIKRANIPDKVEKVNLEVSKADMNNIEHSLFLGNYASCCTAIGSGCNQWTAPAYILCKLTSAIEVKINQEYVGNTMCFLAKIKGKPALIIDNIELQHKYQYNDEIRDTIFDYAKKMTAEIGQPNMPIYASPNRHKVNMDEFKLTQKNFSIVGSTDKWGIYLDFDTDSHKISGKEEFNSYLYKIR